MKKYIPLSKRSKKVQKEAHTAQRGTWYGLSPVTRIAPNKKQYSRAAAKAAVWKDSMD